RSGRRRALLPPMQDQAGAASGSGDPDPPPEHAGGEGGSSSAAAAARLPSRNASSKYDFVKVKVWLGENADHYYVLSRFLLSRMLTVTKIPNHVAIKIALELKKLLVDNSLLDVSQSDLEANLFKVTTFNFI
uniref:Uncharacterized protein n=1 Tax=Aegilops tauschii subsp. strangulata TaxID=200361 RepID=A0A453JA19_AEGTS